VQPLGGNNFKIKLNAAAPSLGETKAEIARTQGTSEARQELYKVAVRADGGAVREDDAKPEALDDDAIELEDGEMVAMAVKDLPPSLKRTCDEERVTLSEGGAAATHLDDTCTDTLVTSAAELTVGKHYWEVEILHDDNCSIHVDVARPNLGPNADYAGEESTDGWFIRTFRGALFGNGKAGHNEAGDIDEGGRVGVLLDLDEGSLRFFKTGSLVQYGPGFLAGSVTGPVVCAVQFDQSDTGFCSTSARLLLQDMGHALLQ
jgi:hypothetical protein